MEKEGVVGKGGVAGGRGFGDRGTSFAGVVRSHLRLTAPHEPQGLGGRIYRLPPLPPTPSISVV